MYHQTKKTESQIQIFLPPLVLIFSLLDCLFLVLKIKEWLALNNVFKYLAGANYMLSELFKTCKDYENQIF